MYFNTHIRRKDNGLQVIVQYKHEGGKWKQKSKQGFENNKKGKQLAKDWAAKMIEELKQSDCLDNNEYKDITFEEFTLIHLKHLKKHSALGSIRNFETVRVKFKDLNNKQMSEIKVLDIQTIVDNLLDELAPSTLKDYLGKLSIIFKDAIEKYNIITTNPVDKITIKTSNIKKEIIVLNSKESMDLLTALDGEYYYITLIGLKTGLRIGEILGLTWGDIDFKKHKININKQWKEIEKNKYGFGSLKSENSNRVVPIHPNLSKELKLYKSMSIPQIDNRLFSYRNTASVTAMLGAKYKRLGYNISVHSLRHTYATNLIGSGLDYRTTAMLLGHTVEMTMKTYSHVNDDMLERANKIINENF